jgi:hypothetical protein
LILEFSYALYSLVYNFLENNTNNISRLKIYHLYEGSKGSHIDAASLTGFRASIRGSATPKNQFHQARETKRPASKALEKSGHYSKWPEVADTVIGVGFSLSKVTRHGLK